MGKKKTKEQEKNKNLTIIFMIIIIIIIISTIILVAGTLKYTKRINDYKKDVYLQYAKDFISKAEDYFEKNELVPITGEIMKNKSYYILVDTKKITKEYPIVKYTSKTKTKGYIFINNNSNEPKYYICITEENNSNKVIISGYKDELTKDSVKADGTCDIKTFKEYNPIQLIGKE